MLNVVTRLRVPSVMLKQPLLTEEESAALATALEPGRYLIKLDTAVTEAGGQPFWYVLDASMTVVDSPDTGAE